ncbi:MAG: heme-binding domain-containing protein [Candidatus Marinarcus sp.]|uniref:heme-binding domain-containing protein n=1 Tax=Candidatus Marinarcus sp. TaxID=3100987 RepID=UPI003B00570F
MKNTLMIILILFIGIQFIPRDNIDASVDITKEIQAPHEIKAILKRSCYDCHSHETRFPWYASIAPVSWMITNHVEVARKWVNFSVWEDYTAEEKTKKLKEIFRAVYVAMPLTSYLSMHEEANMTKEERTLIREWTGVRK